MRRAPTRRRRILRREMLSLPDWAAGLPLQSEETVSHWYSKAEAQMNAPLARVLRSYQERSATYLYEHDSAFLIAPLGAGKGAAALTAIAELIRDGHRRHALVIAPKLVAETVWPAEIASWPHLRHLRVAVLNGSPERRRALLSDAAEREITVIGIDNVRWLVAELAAVADDHPLFDMLVIDETSRLKDPSGKSARALAKVAGRFRTRWGLTGTPRPNSAMDLFMPAAIITDGALWGRAFIPWQKRHFRPRDPFEREWIALPGAEAADRRRLRHHRDDGRRRGHARPAAAQRRGDLRRAAGRGHGGLREHAGGAIRLDWRARNRGGFAAGRDRQMRPDGQRLPLRREATRIRCACTRSKSIGCASWSRASKASRC